MLNREFFQRKLGDAQPTHEVGYSRFMNLKITVYRYIFWGVCYSEMQSGRVTSRWHLPPPPPRTFPCFSLVVILGPPSSRQDF